LNGLGLPLFALLLGGILYSVKLAFDVGLRQKILLLWSMVVPYGLLLASTTFHPMRYTVAISPALLILAGKLAGDMLHHSSIRLRSASIVLVILIIGYSAAYAVTADLYFINDSRLLAQHWVARQVPEGARIETTPHGPNIPADKYVVIARPQGPTKGYPLQESATASRYEVLLELSHWLVERLDSFGRKDGAKRVPYRPWHDRAMDRYRNTSSVFDMSLAGLESRKPDLLIISSQYIERFHDDDESVEASLYRALFAGQTSYVKAAEFKYRLLPWIDPKVEFVNPTIHIFRRTGQTSS
jgi:hypothetical protein